ncbi:MAG: hypothetical protein MRY72_13190 [Aquisalinus sp.]|nr:hypothetical protein [Aquisalinus sp.]
MTIDQKSAEGDLAFMRAILEENDTYDRTFGINYFAAGLLYGLQCLANGILLLGAIDAPTWVWLAIGIMPTVLFLTINISFGWKNRERPFGTGTGKRAIGGAFAGGGMAILVSACIFGWVAYDRADWTIWFLYPIVVCVFQGAIWFTAMIVRRRKWYGLTALGWFASAPVLAIFMNQAGAYVSALGIFLLLFMALPGYVMLQNKSMKT